MVSLHCTITAVEYSVMRQLEFLINCDIIYLQIELGMSSTRELSVVCY